ncbi:MAG: Glu-tRNA(Gln) amidotransferase subunit GatD [Methanocellales archaeon]|nr:Glu-tRNA(Gln) amidotransferase subunit GatD [Methanocellales archaeon]MDD4898809.1 Glu-tRNA(Gln) amidotransferase subunit GatD [Methanocellales archaeon]MDD5447482.1 Glu-tRNA(Gln) amidotransferase subunit GatD [Methanocellales archaeon]
MMIGDRIKIQRGNITYKGILMPSRDDSIVLKLDNGYNIGIKKDAKTFVKIIEKGKKIAPQKTSAPLINPSLPTVSILTTGGTIASKVDYRTGAVTSQFDVEDILRAIPELREIANFKGEVIYNILSENMRSEYWQTLARAIAAEIEGGAEGVMITHGTDTMGYTAAALSFMLVTPVPIVLVGSQRSADRPSSDNAMNAVCAAKVATSDIAEVSVVMHATMSDNYCLIHRGTRVRKMHTSRRDAFHSINASPIGKVDYSTREIETFVEYKKKGEHRVLIRDHIEPKCSLVKFYPGADPEIVDHYASRYKGLVIEGTGLGHVSTEWIPHIKKAVEKGISIVITSQCFSGRICDLVYDTGRDLLKAGIIEGGDMLPETALVKLMWILGGTKDPDEVRTLMRKNIAGEISGL